MDIAGRDLPLNTVIAAGVLAVIGLALIVSPRFGMAAGQDGGQAQGQNLSYLLDDGEPSLGNASAPVAIVYWGDYQCPQCGQFERTTFGDLQEDYIETGDILFVKKDYPNVAGRKSELAAQVGECIWRMEGRDRFWTWHRGMYNETIVREIGVVGSVGSSSTDIETTLIDIADRILDINTVDLSACLDDRQEAIGREIRDDGDEAQDNGIYGTPGFIIYNRVTGQRRTIWGAQGIEAFEERIGEVQDG